MKSTRWRIEAALAAVCVAVIVAGAAALYFTFTARPMHTNAAAIPSTAADVGTGRYAAAVEEARRHARALLVEEDLPGLSVAVAMGGAIVWAEGFGYADVDRTPITPITRFRDHGTRGSQLHCPAIKELRSCTSTGDRFSTARAGSPWVG